MKSVRFAQPDFPSLITALLTVINHGHNIIVIILLSCLRTERLDYHFFTFQFVILFCTFAVISPVLLVYTRTRIIFFIHVYVMSAHHVCFLCRLQHLNANLIPLFELSENKITCQTKIKTNNIFGNLEK